VTPIRALWLGDSGLTIELPAPDPAQLLAFAAAIDARIAEGLLPGAIETLPGLRSVTLYFDPNRADPDPWVESLLALAAGAPPVADLGQDWTIPVCCDNEFAPDLAALAASKSVSTETILAEFLAATVSVRMLGFLPGFAYMGDVPPLCRAPKRATPRSQVPAGSLAVAGANCALYPWDSPGGWNLIGRTPITLFDAQQSERPCLLAPGDRVTWRRVDRVEFEQMRLSPSHPD